MSRMNYAFVGLCSLRNTFLIFSSLTPISNAETPVYLQTGISQRNVIVSDDRLSLFLSRHTGMVNGCPSSR